MHRSPCIGGKGRNVDGPRSSDATRAMDAVRRLVRALRTSNREVERSVGVSAAQLFVLRAIESSPRLSMADLVQRTLTHQSTVSEVVGRLVEAGLVSRQIAADDGRRSELELTTKGRALCRRAPAPMQGVLAEALLHMPAAQRRTLAEGLEAWVEACHLAGLPATMLFEPPRRTRTRGLSLPWRRDRSGRG